MNKLTIHFLWLFVSTTLLAGTGLKHQGAELAPAHENLRWTISESHLVIADSSTVRCADGHTNNIKDGAIGTWKRLSHHLPILVCSMNLTFEHASQVSQVNLTLNIHKTSLQQFYTKDGTPVVLSCSRELNPITNEFDTQCKLALK